VAASGSGQGVSLADDVMGFNYNTQHQIDAFHAAHPEKPSLMTEEGSTTATRGIYFDDRDHVHLAAYDREARPGYSSSIEEAWRFVQKRPFLAGMFVWTGFDYRGETTPFGWPAISSQFGMFDTTGVVKDTGYYLQSVWTDQPMVHLLPHWNWAGREGQPIEVWAYSNTEQVELFLDGRSLGARSMEKDSHVVWSAPYARGILSAKGYSGGKAVAAATVETSGDASTVILTADKKVVGADGRDVAVITVNVCDSKGRIVPTADDEIRFEVEGPIRVIGVGNGDPGSHEVDRAAARYGYASLVNWRSLAVDSTKDRPEVGASVDTSKWRDPFRWLPPEQQPPSTNALVLRGEFSAPPMQEGETVALFVASLDDQQTVFLNGKPVFPKLEDSGALIVDINPASLQSVNSLTFVFKAPTGGVPALADASQAGVNWATLRIAKPASPWKRKVFNGYAQVIVQSTGATGNSIVHATASGLKGAKISLDLESK
jgi:beta-galactosidase